MDRSRFSLSLRLVLGVLLVLSAGTAFSQPFDAWLTNSSGHSFIQLPLNPALVFAGGSYTFEAWVSVTDAAGCSTIAGNNWQQSSWIGVCGTALRSYVRGSGSAFDAGVIPANDWTHIAVTFDNATKRRTHYIDGEEVGTRVDDGPIAATSYGVGLELIRNRDPRFSSASLTMELARGTRDDGEDDNTRLLVVGSYRF